MPEALLPLGYKQKEAIMYVIYSRREAAKMKKDLPVIFLAGFFLKKEGWEVEFCEHLQKEFGDEFYVVLPEKFRDRHSLAKYRAKGKKTFESKHEWRKHFLRLAAKRGCVVFYIPDVKQNQEMRHTQGFNHVNRTFEVWQNVIRKKKETHFVIGAQSDSLEHRLIRLAFSSAYDDWEIEYPMHQTLKMLARAAFETSRNGRE